MEREQKQTLELVDMSDKHTVLVMADHALEFPDLYLDVYIAGDKYEQRNFAEMFGRSYCKKADSPEKADLVVFTGGPDVDPQLYGEKAHPETQFDTNRDDEDIELFFKCIDLGIPMLGICRGAQFGHVMHNGKLYQHISGHQGKHKAMDVEDRTMIEHVSSVHHQAVIPNNSNGMQIVATAVGADCFERWTNDKNCVKGLQPDIEAFFYRDTCFFGIQGHPEYRGYNFFALWAIKKIHKYVNENPDITLIDNFRRIKPELLAERQGKNSSVRKVK